MSKLQIYNTLSGKKEEFVPLSGNLVKIYSCGPTVYDVSHLGHARSAITWDVVVRYLRYAGYDVLFARNITDVDDKIINRAKEMGWRPEQVAREYTYTFWRDMRALNVTLPDFEPRATEYLNQMIAFIDSLIKSRHAYASNGDVYFDVSSFKDYGKLKKQRLEDMLSGTRELAVSQQELQERKKSPLDFALWKGTVEGELGWITPWGFGRPGWHLECSTMIKDVLGETIDIHGAGEDLVFPHNENEVAQSEALHGKPLAHFWMHNGMINIDSEKMSKSLGNFKTIGDLLKIYSADTLRLFILQTHYRSPIDFSTAGLNAARSGLRRLIRAATLTKPTANDVATHMGEAVAKQTVSQELDFNIAMNNDFNTAEAVSVLHSLAYKIFVEPDDNKRNEYQQGLRTYATVLGLTLEDSHRTSGSELTKALRDSLLHVRQIVRTNKDYKTSDLIRDELIKHGIKVMDTPEGTTLEWFPGGNQSCS